MATDRVTFAFDFVDPGSYLVHELLGRWSGAEAEERVDLLPLELRPPPRPPIRASDPGWEPMERALARVARDAEIPYAPPTFVPWTRKAHELALHGLEKGVRIHGLLFRARFEEALDVGRVDVLVELAARAGLDAAETRTILGVDRFAEAIEEGRGEALRLGIRGVPTLLVHGGERLEGFRSAEELRSFLDGAGLAREGSR